jgi:hypothetical protein
VARTRRVVVRVRRTVLRPLVASSRTRTRRAGRDVMRTTMRFCLRAADWSFEATLTRTAPPASGAGTSIATASTAAAAARRSHDPIIGVPPT